MIIRQQGGITAGLFAIPTGKKRPSGNPAVFVRAVQRNPKK